MAMFKGYVSNVFQGTIGYHSSKLVALSAIGIYNRTYVLLNEQ